MTKLSVFQIAHLKKSPYKYICTAEGRAADKSFSPFSKQYLYHFYRNSMNETYAVEFFSLLKKTVFLQPYICNYNPKSIRQGISIKIRVGPDMIFFAGCRISGRIIRLSCRISGLLLPDNRISGRIIRHCRISGPTLIKMTIFKRL